MPGYSLEQPKNAVHAHLAENKAGEQWVELRKILLLKTALKNTSESGLKRSKVAEQGGFNSVALLHAIKLNVGYYTRKNIFLKMLWYFTGESSKGVFQRKNQRKKKKKQII